MTPPIRKGDGTPLAPSGIAQVRAGDGDVYYQRNVIPDNVVIQQTATTWSQGDGTWVDDATDDGSQDVSVTGDPQDATLSDGSESIDGDGNDYGTLTLPSDFEGDGLQTFAVEFVVEHTDTSGDVAPFGISNSGDQRLEFLFNLDSSFNTDNGNFVLRLADQNDDRIEVSASSNPNLNDGNRHDISVIVNDSTNQDVDVIIDGSSVSLDFRGQAGNPSSFTTWNNDLAYWASNRAGSISKNLTGELAAFRWWDTNQSSQTINDYPF